LENARRIGFTRSHIFFPKKLKADVDPRNEGEIKKKIKEIKHEIEETKKKIEGIKSENEELGYSRAQRIRESNHKEPLRIEEYSTVDEESDVIGFKEDKRRLVSELTYTSYRRLEVISIVGAVGSGKTTLAMEIYNRSEIKGYSDYRAWVSSSRTLS
jgi:ABC-type glutathione transport system ATPase component